MLHRIESPRQGQTRKILVAIMGIGSLSHGQDETAGADVTWLATRRGEASAPGRRPEDARRSNRTKKGCLRVGWPMRTDEHITPRAFGFHRQIFQERRQIVAGDDGPRTILANSRPAFPDRFVDGRAEPPRRRRLWDSETEFFHCRSEHRRFAFCHPPGFRFTCGRSRYPALPIHGSILGFSSSRNP